VSIFISERRDKHFNCFIISREISNAIGLNKSEQFTIMDLTSVE